MTDTKSDTFAYSLLGEFADLEPRALPPLHLWQPTHVSDVDMEIKADGRWYHEGTAITRQRLTRLFSTILRREADDEYYLITPAEKCRVRVEIAPFVVVLMTVTGSGRQQRLTLTTNVADEVTVDAGHPLSFRATALSELTPFVEIRDGLQAMFARTVYYQLMDLLCVESLPDAESDKASAEEWYGVWSGGTFFAVQRASEVDAG